MNESKISAIVADLPSSARELFEYISSYFVDTYYNKLIVTAREYLSRKMRPTLTECYRLAISNYFVIFRNAADANRIFNDFADYYHRYNTSAGYEACVFKIVQECVPGEFFEQMRPQQKTTLLVKIWVAAIQSFTDIIYRQYLGMILDDRSKETQMLCVSQLQDEMLNILSTIREDMYNDFFGATSRKTDSLTPQARASRNKEKAESDKKIAALEQILYQQHKKIKKLEKTVDRITAENQELVARLKAIRRPIEEPVDESEYAQPPPQPPPPQRQRQRQQQTKSTIVKRDYMSVNDFKQDLDRSAPINVGPAYGNTPTRSARQNTDSSPLVKTVRFDSGDTSLVADIAELTHVRNTAGGDSSQIDTSADTSTAHVTTDADDRLPALDMF